MVKNKTLVYGASLKPERYSNKAIKMLQESAVPHVAIGLRAGQIGNTKILVGHPELESIDTVSLYVGPARQDDNFIQYIISLAPRRVIFNPGTEHPKHIQALREANIEVDLACTLVLLRTGQY